MSRIQYNNTKSEPEWNDKQVDIYFSTGITLIRYTHNQQIGESNHSKVFEIKKTKGPKHGSQNRPSSRYLNMIP